MPVLVATGRAFLFSLISLIEKGKQCNEQTTSGNQQTDYPQENHNNFISRQSHHLPSYVFRQAGHQLGRLPPLSWVPCIEFYHTLASASIKIEGIIRHKTLYENYRRGLLFPVFRL